MWNVKQEFFRLDLVKGNVKHTERRKKILMVSPRDKSFENCKERPLRIFPIRSLKAKAVATPPIHQLSERFDQLCYKPLKWL